MDHDECKYIENVPDNDGEPISAVTETEVEVSDEVEVIDGHDNNSGAGDNDRQQSDNP